MAEFEEYEAIGRKIKMLVEENQRLQYTKQRYVEYAEKLKQKAEMLDKIKEEILDLVHQIDPVINIKVSSSTERSARSKKIAEVKGLLLQQMQSGQQVTSDYIKSAFPDVCEEAYTVHNIIAWLSEQEKVQKVKDGVKVRLFI